MDEKEIKELVAQLANIMMEKGLKNPVARAYFESNCMPYVFLTWDDGTICGGCRSSRTGFCLKDKFDEAFEYLNSLPSKEEIKKQEFLQAVSNAIALGKENGIALGKENGIEMEYIAPLLEAMKALSENVIK